jgi:hypothetical protein
MELYFCDLCQDGVSKPDLDSGLATLNGERVTCKTCNEAMGSSTPTPVSLSKGPTGPKRSSLSSTVTPMVAAVLASASILLTLVAVVALLARTEWISNQQATDFAEVKQQVKQVADRQRGTREGMIQQAREAGESAIYDELKRFEIFERDLEQLRDGLTGKAPQTAPDGAQGTLEAPRSLAVDNTEKVVELEAQLLFLQARVFELQEESARGGSRVTQQGLQEKVLLPEGELGKIVAQLTHEDPIERVSALYALANVSEVGVVRHVIPLLEDSDGYIRALTARVLERGDARSSVQGLIKALDDSEPVVREAAVSALRAITSKQFQFNPRGPATERFKAVKRWNGWWNETWKDFLYGGK